MKKKFTYKFQLWGKKGIFTCHAHDRAEADELFSDMLVKNTQFDSVIEDKIERADPRRQTGKDNIGDIFEKFGEIFGDKNFFSRNK